MVHAQGIADENGFRRAEYLKWIILVIESLHICGS